ncbi:MAG: peptidoglycan DD-metalloendopeptidase family protein [Thermodesulfobacteriota bacterium]|nr:MAG: peptidoglycan DD-metalloendopeptidase family protein [Thermodesulfobacteriota bacterium]
MKKLNIRPIIIVLVFCLGFWSAAGPARAGGLKERKQKQKLSVVKSRIKKEKERIKKILRKETSVLSEINRINKNIVRKRRELRRLKASLTRIRKKIRTAEAKIKALEKKKEKLSARLAMRLRAMYKMRNGEIVNMAFSPGLKDSTDLGRRHKYMTLITEYDSVLLGKYEENLSKLESEKKTLVGLKGRLESARRGLVSGKREKEALKGDRVALLVAVREEKDGRLKMVGELEKAARDLTALLDGLKGGRDARLTGFAAMKGRLAMPVRGSVTSHFGKVRHPKFKTITFNKGIIIDTPAGRPVKSVYRGRVIYTGWLKGYGQIMIIDHGGGFYTLFAHLESILKDRGAAVAKGEEIAIVGDSGPYAEAGLYFEIRKKGVPQDPMKWFASR